jgi:hypothetical protein
MKRPSTLVADDFMVPDVLETPEFRLRMLTVNDLIKDYDAVMSSVEHLKSVWPGSGWPEGLTLEEDLVDLGWHQKEFLMRLFTSIQLRWRLTILKFIFGSGRASWTVVWMRGCLIPSSNGWRKTGRL